MSSRALRLAFGALWAATLAGVALAHTGLRLRNVPAPHDALFPSVRTVQELATHNALVSLWPLALVAIGWPALIGVRLVGDALIAAQLLGHGLVVGSTLGERPELWRFLPHLPVEWLAIALPAAAWITARRRPVRRGSLLGVLVLTCAALVGAAAIETYLTPIP
jgi:hypothetical protein